MTTPQKHTHRTHSAKPIASNDHPARDRNFYACLISWIVVIVIAIGIFLMSAKTAQSLDVNSGIISFVKNALASCAASLFGHEVDISPVGHFCEYFIFGIALCNALRFSTSLKRAFISATILASAYGISDELHQLFVPTRSCDPLDWIVDTCAAFLGALLVYGLFTHITNNRKTKRANG